MRVGCEQSIVIDSDESPIHFLVDFQVYLLPIRRMRTNAPPNNAESLTKSKRWNFEFQTYGAVVRPNTNS